MIHRFRGPVFAGLLALFLGVLPAFAASTARSTADRVSVRSRPGFAGEVLTRLKKGQEVEVLGDVHLLKPAVNEPADWVRIALPPETPVWVTADLVDPATKTVKADVLNARAGPGWDFGSVGRLKQGTRLEARGEAKNGWLEIQAPPGCWGFVQAAFVETGAATPSVAPPPPAPPVAAASGTPRKSPPAAGTATPAAANPVPAAPLTAGKPPATPAPAPAAAPTAVAESQPMAKTVVDEAPPAVATIPPPAPGPGPSGSPARASRRSRPSNPPTAPAPATASGSTSSPASGAAAAAAASTGATPSAPPTEAGASAASAPAPAAAGLPAGLEGSEARRVRREGLVIRPFNIQAPSYFALKATDSGKTVNFLFSTRPEPINWREYRGKVVIVTGREYLDARYFWQNTPLLDVETIEAVR